ncbi:Gfo/Idh/MocA family oxidoreductase [Mariniblastus sp.]|nr:Gfo/Idh/MocA family oxidoreductase [Mariniblastus sp.]
MNRLRVAVIGAGHLGKIHTRLLYSQPNQVKLVGVADPSPEAQRAVLNQAEIPVVSDYRKLIPEIDAAVIATPTRFHHAVAMDLLENGIHTLIEKPLTDSVTDAEELVQVAESNNCVVQVGHVERFNPAIATALRKVGTPKFIQASRTSTYTFRSTDVGVVHDLMIHDIDLVNSMFAGTMTESRAVGISVFGHHEDTAQARLEFSCGGVANITASRCSFSPERTIQIFGTDGFASVNLADSTMTAVRIPSWLRQRELDVLQASPDQQAWIREQLFESVLKKKQIAVPKTNAILSEQEDWIEAIKNGTTPKVSVQQGAEAVAIADSVLNQINTHRWSDTELRMTGPTPTLEPTGIVDDIPFDTTPAEPAAPVRKAA